MHSILIVEDYESLQSLYKAAFEQAGYKVDAVASGNEALNKVTGQHFDVIILDMLMLGLSGLDVLRQYNFEKNSPDTKIVVVSNLDSPNIMQKAESFGISRYLIKAHYTPQQIVAIVSDLLSTPKSA